MPKTKNRKRDRKCILCGADPGWRCRNIKVKHHTIYLMRDHKER